MGLKVTTKNYKASDEKAKIRTNAFSARQTEAEDGLTYPELVEFCNQNDIPTGYQDVTRGRTKEGEEREVAGLLNFALFGLNAYLYRMARAAATIGVDPVVAELTRIYEKGLNKAIPAFKDITLEQAIAQAKESQASA